MSLYDVPADLSGDAEPGVVAFARVADAVGLGARWPGQVALLRRDGSIAGSLLGDAFSEGSAKVPRALDLVRVAATGLMIELDVDHDEAERAGLPCGGRAGVLVQPTASIPASVRADIEARRPTALLTLLDDPSFATRAPAPDGDERYLGDDSPDSLARALLARGEPGDAVLDTADGRVLVSVFVPAPRLVVIGSGALAAALEDQLGLLGWACEALTHADSGVEAVRRLGPGDGVLVIDHRGEVDLPILAEALARGVGYVAALGSRRTQEARRSRLRGGGVDEQSISRLRGPAGLDIGSRTPAEIAVAIVAEMLSVRSGATGGALRDRSGSINSPRS